MTLTRVWTPTGNYSGGGQKRIIVLHSTEGFTGPNGAYDCAHYFQGNVGASAQVCIDNTPGKVWEGVNRAYGAWTQCGYNSVAVSAEQCGYASWSRDYWLSNREQELRNAAAWIAEESAALSIPITELNDSQAQGGGWGVCYHSHLGGTGCGHSDPGSGYPLDKVLEWARGGGAVPPETVAPPPQTGGLVTAAAVYDSHGRLHFAAINQRNDVCYKGPDGNWYPISTEEWHKAQTGVGMVIGPDDEITIVWTQRDGDAVHTWQKHAGDPEQWRITRIGASYL